MRYIIELAQCLFLWPNSFRIPPYSNAMKTILHLFSIGVIISSALVSRSMGQGMSGFEEARKKMVDEEVVAAGVKNPRVIEAMRKTPRHEFVPLNQRKNSYFDMALPIGDGQTISPPFVVASMTEAIDPQPEDKVLEIGTGSGYQAAVLSPLVKEVYSIEIVEPLGRKAAAVLERLHFKNVKTKIGDGYLGWPEYAPFDKLIVTCSPENVPEALVKQLKEGGRMVIPVGERYQQTLYLMVKKDGELQREALRPTLFVPMTGQAESNRKNLPDPANPTIENGGFEKVEGDPPSVANWHYQRQLQIVEKSDSPEGGKYVALKNSEPGRNAQALQGFAVDGRKVKQMTLSYYVRAEDVKPGQNALQLPSIIFVFYDENRATIEEKSVGLWRGSFAWRQERQTIFVPAKTREAIIRIGMNGATGETAFDAIKLSAKK